MKALLDAASRGATKAGLGKALSEATILIVDDDEIMCEFIRLNLAESGFTSFEMAGDGAEALRKIAAFPIAIVILDMNMPVMDGFEVLRQLRADGRTRELPVLVTTGIDTREGRNEVLRAGASNLISKPLDGRILVERTASLLERSLLVAELTRYRTRLEHELSVAREMQGRLMPSAEETAAIAMRYGCRISARYEPSSELGGDLWGMKPIDDRRLMVFNADFSGHGVAAALNTFRLHTIVRELSVDAMPPDAIMAEINDRLYELLEPGQFATMLCAIVDREAGTLSYSGAAAPEPIVGDLRRGSFRRLDASGILLGAQSGSTYDVHELEFGPGSFLFLYSDALMESPDSDGRMLGPEGVERLVEEALATAPASPMSHILERFFRRAAMPLSDDLTTIWVSK